MSLMNPVKEKHPIVAALFLSLMVHLAVGVLLLSYLSTHSASSPEPPGMKLVWISFNDKKENTKMAFKNNRSDQTPSFNTITYQEPLHIETSDNHPENIHITSAPATHLANDEASAKNEEPVYSTSKETFYNISRYNKNETSGSGSSSKTVIAYPLYKENSPPVYPEIARARGYEGIVLVSAEILSNGRVGEVKIRKSSGYAILDQSAIQAVKPWKFEPAKKSGNPFTAWVELPIKFILNNNSQS